MWQSRFEYYIFIGNNVQGVQVVSNKSSYAYVSFVRRKVSSLPSKKYCMEFSTIILKLIKY